MLNILVPMAGNNKLEGYEMPYPKPLVEVGGIPLIEQVIQQLQKISSPKKFIFVVNQEDCIRFYLDNILKLIVKENVTVIKVNKNTKGAACSALMAIGHINNDSELIIANSDSIIFQDLNGAISHFKKDNADAGTICFESIHPKWSYVRLDNKDQVVEAAEKKPISQWANAGFYYYRQGRDFISSAMSMIMKDASVDGNYFIAPTLNEMVLKNKTIKSFRIGKEEYINFFSMEKINEYESRKSKGSS
jgi:NDP-sugar pyrophosphorylase family protein